MKFLALMIALVATVASGLASEAEEVALRGIEAMNRNRGADFVTVAHPKLMEKMRDMMIARFEQGMADGSTPGELRDFGVSTLKDLRALPAEAVAKALVDHMSDPEPARLREIMHTAKFAVVRSRAIDADTVVVTISIDVGGGLGPKTSDVLSRTAGKVWKYWGFPELAKEPKEEPNQVTEPTPPSEPGGAAKSETDIERLQRVAAEVERRRLLREQESAAPENAKKSAQDHESGVKEAADAKPTAAREIMRHAEARDGASKSKEPAMVHLPEAPMETVRDAWQMIFGETVTIAERAKSRGVSLVFASTPRDELRQKMIAALREQGIYVIERPGGVILDTEPDTK